MNYPNYRVAVEALIIHNGKVLLTKRVETAKVAPGAWNVPAGKVKYTEITKNAIVRECLEETNLEVEVVDLLQERAFETKSGDEKAYRLVFTFLVKPINGVLNFKINDEHSEFDWINPNEVAQTKYDSMMLQLRDCILKIDKKKIL